ncbi:MAG TPA: hypothetical protein VFV08_03205 [Puia sp.]|nr:hypothetical protein [Puia sp.]
MRHLILPSIPILAVFLFSCKKDYTHQSITFPRTVQYVLYTNKDFSDNHKIIRFTLTMRRGNQVIWDSVLAPMQISQIPDSLHKIVVERAIPANVNSDLLVGFIYDIDAVGYSWWLDSCAANESFKKIEFPFQ